MKKFLIVAVAAACILTSSIAFANIISFGQSNTEPFMMISIGLGLLGIAAFGRRHV